MAAAVPALRVLVSPCARSAGQDGARSVGVGAVVWTLRWRRRRFVCGGCGERHLETHREFDGKLTRRLARRLVVDAQQMSLRAVARTHGVGWGLIMGHVGVWATLIGDHRRSQRCGVLLVDETSMRRRHRYVTVIVNGESGQILDMLPGRSEASLSRFFAAQGHKWCAGVKVVVSDGSKAYRAAIERHLGHATHVLDRFGVIGWFAAALTAVRRDIQRRQPEGTTPVFDPDVFRARFVLLRRPDRLGNTERAQLEALFETHPRLRAAWDALGELHSLYLAADEAGALAAPRQVHRPLPDRRPARVRSNRQHAHRPHAPNPRLPRRRTAQQRPHRRH